MMGEYCLNCEATQRKLDFYVEQFKKVEGDRDHWREIALKAREALVKSIGWMEPVMEGFDISKDSAAYKGVLMESKYALASFPKEPSDNG